MFGLSLHVFNAILGRGELLVQENDSGIVITGAGIDSDDQEIFERFSVEYDQGDANLSDAWFISWIGGEIPEGLGRYEVPVYVEYVDMYGVRGNWKGTFVIYTKGENVRKPTIQYIKNIASKVDTTEYVTIYGHDFNDDLNVFLERPDDTCILIMGKDLYREYNTADGYDTISFIFGKPFVAVDSSCSEICGLYGINLGYGTCDAKSIEAGTADSSTAWNNNLYLIRYRYDSANKDVSEQTPGGLMATVDPSCFYSTDIDLITDDYNSDDKTPSSGGVSGKLGKDIYFRIKPDTDCTKIGYYRVKLKYSRNLPKRYGEMTIDGVVLNEGDLVWLDKQFDGGNGLWMVQTGDWIGLKTYLDGQAGNDSEYNPCEHAEQEPLPVDGLVIADLGVKVKDRVTVACDSDFPEENMYGSQRVCNRIVNPGDTVLFTNQSSGDLNGVWEVTCAEWIQRTYTIPPHDGAVISGDDFVVVQNDIDFCTCEHGGKNIFHIWYYYLNGSCYLARASRTVKITCGMKGSLFPSKGVDVTDYKVTVGSNEELVTDSHRTAGDPVKETCMEAVENYDAEHRVDIKDSRYNCGSEVIVAPNGMKICRCNHVYNIDADTAFSSRDRSGFSIVFWQYEEEKWHLYAYIGSGRYDIGMNYYVYHICTNGIADVNDVDENGEVVTYDSTGKPGKETRDAWFVAHGGHLATGFGLFDDSWNFKLQRYEVDDDGNAEPVGIEYSHVLNADTLYSMWAIKCTTTFCAVRVYSESSMLRTQCDCTQKPTPDECMNNAETTSSVMTEVIPTPDTWGFKFYNEAIGKKRLCDIWNSMPH